MRRRAARASLLLLLFSAPLFAASAAVDVSTAVAPRRYRLEDTDKPRGGFLQRIENAIPVAILIFFGFRGNVQIRGEAKN